MLRTGHSDPASFSPGLLAQLPAERVDGVITTLTATLGGYKSLEITPSRWIAHFARGTDDVLIHLDSNNKIDGLFFRPPLVTTLDDGLRALHSSTGTLAYVIVIDDRLERAAFNASDALAVGSTFKLAILCALRDEIAKGHLRWDDIVSLRATWKSLPSGVLQAWPDKTPLTVATLAAEMISISDNTAADALIRRVPWRALRPYAGQNQPFLTTRELFTLKSRPGASLRAAYLAASTPGARAAVLTRVDKQPLPAIDELLSAPQPAVEWHYSVRDLCRLMKHVADIPLMTINPGVADARVFRHVAFKGGSDLGIINLTTAVTTKRGTRICFSATLNDPTKAIDERGFEVAYAGVLQYLAGQ